MKNIISQDLIKRIILGLLIIVTVLYILTGFGITQFRVVETLTFGLLTKNVSFKIHDHLFIPFIILLGLHVFCDNQKRKGIRACIIL